VTVRFSTGTITITITEKTSPPLPPPFFGEKSQATGIIVLACVDSHAQNERRNQTCILHADLKCGGTFSCTWLLFLSFPLIPFVIKLMCIIFTSLDFHKGIHSIIHDAQARPDQTSRQIILTTYTLQNITLQSHTAIVQSIVSSSPPRHIPTHLHHQTTPPFLPSKSFYCDEDEVSTCKM